MFGKTTRSWWMTRETWIAIAALAAGLLVSKAFAVEPPANRKMARQIDVMEKIVDQVLIDSPNFLVSGRGNTRGLYVENYGVIFTFSASLLNKGKNWNFDFKDGFKIMKDGDKRVIVIDPEDELDDEDLEKLAEADDRRDHGDRGDQVQERLYRRGKAELIDVFMDYGDTITSLQKGQWVAIVAFLRDSSYFSDQHISKLALKAKIDDLQAFASEKISEEEMVKRIVEEEY